MEITRILTVPIQNIVMLSQDITFSNEILLRRFKKMKAKISFRDIPMFKVLLNHRTKMLKFFNFP